VLNAVELKALLFGGSLSAPAQRALKVVTMGDGQPMKCASARLDGGCANSMFSFSSEFSIGTVCFSSA
jgi:hypothetical protein